MNKIINVKKLTIIIISLISLTALVSQLFNSPRDYRNPGYFSSYPNSGYYKIDPETILESLDRGETNLFTPLSEDPSQVKSLHNSISWTQVEYLKIAGVLNQFIWNEPLDLEGWKIYFIYFEVGCKDNLSGFDDFSIVYYKYLGVMDWKRVYTTRLIEVSPWNGIVRWGGEAKFTQPLLSGWGNVDLTKFAITADESLRIAEGNGGKEARLKVENECMINIIESEGFIDTWQVKYSSAHFETDVNAYTGKYKILNAEQ
jgi:hypothetical protein